MRLVIQRVLSAAVDIAGRRKSEIGQGLLILVGVCDEDTDDDIEYLCQKVVKMRIFDDREGVMLPEPEMNGLRPRGANLHITDVADSGILVVSQFTLMASTRKGNRPSYIHASRPEIAMPMYERFVARLSELFGKAVQTGVFGADMQVSLVNDGPVTIFMDSHLREAF